MHNGNQLKHLVDDMIIKNNRIVEIALAADGSYDSNGLVEIIKALYE